MSIAAMLSCFSQPQERLDALLAQIQGEAGQDNVHLCLWDGGEWVQEGLMAQTAVLVFDAGQRERLQTALGQLESFRGQTLLVTGLDSHPDPQSFLVKLAEIKEKRCPQRPFHWVMLVSPKIEGAFRGLQTFLDGKCYWFDLRLAIADIEQSIDELWQTVWQQPSPRPPSDRHQARQALSDWLTSLATQEVASELDPISVLQGKLSLLQGLALENQGESASLTVRRFYRESLDTWELLGDEEPLIWLNIRLAYLCLLEATGERDRSHPLWQQIQAYAQAAIADLAERQWRFFHLDTLELLGQVLRGLEDWENLRQAAENSLIFFYQLSPFIPSDTNPIPTVDCPWTDSELQSQIALAHAYLSEALIEQWKFDEAEESLKRAREMSTKVLIHPYPFTAWLHYLSGRIALANDHPKEAAQTLHKAQQLLSFTDSPRLYLAILVELRECYLQFEDWLMVLAIDQEYQSWEYRLGVRAFVGAAPLPCAPHQRLSCHPLTPEKFLGGEPWEPTEVAQPLQTGLSWQKLQTLWRQTPPPIVVLSGETGCGRSSWLATEIMQGLAPWEGVLVPWTGDWGGNLLRQLDPDYPWETLEGIEEDEWPALPNRGIWVILDGVMGSLPWQQVRSAAVEAREAWLWQGLMARVRSQEIRLVLSLPLPAIADFQAELRRHLGEEGPPLQVQSLPLLTVSQAEQWLAQAQAGVQYPWSPSLRSQVLGDLAIEPLAADGGALVADPGLYPLDLQLVGAELENKCLTQSVDYQRQKREQWLQQSIQRQLSFLPEPVLKKIRQLLRALTDDQGTPCLKTDHQLLRELYKPQMPLPEDGPPEYAPTDVQQLLSLLTVLQKARLVVVLYQGMMPYYRLATPHIAQAIQGEGTQASPTPSRPLSGKLTPKSPSSSGSLGGDRRQETQALIADLAMGGSPDEQVAIHRLQAAERQYQRLLAGINLERHAAVILRQFETHPLDALLAAVQTGQELQRLINDDTLLVDYPSLAPLLTLHNILAQIHERNRFQHRASVTCLRLSPQVDNLTPLVLTADTSGKARIWSFHGALQATLRGHHAPITAVEWSPNGQYILTASADNTVKLWSRQGEILSTLRGHTDWVRSAHFSPRHEFIITASRDNTIRLWNFAGEMLTLCEGHTNWVRNAEFNCNGQILLSASRDGTARIWDLEGRAIAVLQGHNSWVRNAQFSPDGQLIVTASADGTARIWDLTGKCLTILKGHHNWVRNALWSPDGKMVVTASSDGTARIWAIKGKCLALLQGHQHPLHDARFSPAGDLVVTCSLDGTARLWSRGGHLVSILRGHQKDVYHAEFSPDGRFIFTISADSTARQWDITPKNSRPLEGHGHWVRYAHFNPKGDKVLTVSRDKTARLWNLRGEVLAVLEGHQGWIREGQFSPDGQFVVTASADKAVHLWSVSGKRLATLRGHQDAVLSVRFSPDGQYVLSAGKDGLGWVWNSTGQALASLRKHTQSIFGAEFSLDGQFIVTASEDGTAIIWDIVGRELGVCRGHGGAVYDAQFSPDNQWIVTASADGTARIWDFLGQPVTTLAGHQSIVYQAQFSPDSDLIVTASADKTARIWNRYGKALAVLYGHQGLVSTAQWSPDGQLIVTTSNDGTARVWDRLGRELATLKGHQAWVRSAEFSADGRWVVTASTDGTARLWPMEGLDQLLERGCQWLEDYLLYNPLVREADRAIAQLHPTLGADGGNS